MISSATTAARFLRVPPETVFFVVIAVPTIMWGAAGGASTPNGIEIVLIGVLVALFGLPHGALDPLIARRAGLWRGPLGFLVFNAVYFTIVAAVLIVWLTFPVFGLVGFLAVSAAHFGSDWNTDRPWWVRTATGAGVLSLPALGHRDEVAVLFETLAPGGAVVAQVTAVLGVVALVAMIITAVVAARSSPPESLEIVVVAALALTAPPLVFFAIYFCALHSARHLREGFRAERADRLWAIASAVAYTIIPIALAVMFLILVPRGVTLDDSVLRVVFIALAGLTVPHMVLTAISDRARRPQLMQIARSRPETGPIRAESGTSA